MKKVKILGKSIPILVLVLLGVGMVSGALVGYLSNQVEADITVESPMEQEISKTNGAYGSIPITFPGVHGGESVTLWTRTTNLADAPITGNVNNIVTNPSGVTCADFEKVEVRTYDGSAWDPTAGYYDLIPELCTDTSWNTVTFSYGPEPITWPVGQVGTSEIIVTFKTDAMGTYTFTSQVVP